MSRYVEYDSLIADSYESDMWDRGTQRFNMRIVEVDDIEKAPFIDLVRCAECKFKSLYDDGETKYYYCALEDRPNRQWSVDDWNFCFWGERKESE